MARSDLRRPTNRWIAVVVAASGTLALAVAFTTTMSPIPPAQRLADSSLSAPVLATPPTASGSSSWTGPESQPARGALPVQTIEPSTGPAASPVPIRLAVDISLVADPRSMFASEATQYMCAAAAMQMVLNVIGPSVDTSVARQRAIYVQAATYTTRADSRNGGWGPAGMAAFLTHSGSAYRLVVYPTVGAALRASAVALSTTRRPVILMAWWGAHAWVMTGIRADADPARFAEFRLTGAYILDPWYPRVSSIWGRSAVPGAFHDMANLAHNFIGWKRPEAHYPARDGRFLVILPVAAAAGSGG